MQKISLSLRGVIDMAFSESFKRHNQANVLPGINKKSTIKILKFNKICLKAIIK
jgi:hypothetical protein